MTDGATVEMVEMAGRLQRAPWHRSAPSESAGLTPQMQDFDVAAVYRALDERRQAHRLSWSQVTREINRLSAGAPVRPISVSTVTGMRTRAVVEADGVLQMLRWLNRTPESFVADHPLGRDVNAQLPSVPASRILRFDTRKLYDALNAQRNHRGMTWAQVAGEVGIPASSLSHLIEGGRTWFPHVMRMTRWLDRPAAEFTRPSDR